MAKKEETLSYRSYSHEDEVKRAKWFKEDLDKGDGWSVAGEVPDYKYWIKTFDGEEVPTKVLYVANFPFPIKGFQQLLDPQNLPARLDWDKNFVEHELLETYPDDGGSVVYMRSVLSFPLKDRSFVLYLPPGKQIDWYGKQALFLMMKNWRHASKPEGEDGLVRATNGGNFYVVLPDQKDPENACTVFGLSNNVYNGWVPNMEWLQKMIVPNAFNNWFACLRNGYEKYFKN